MKIYIIPMLLAAVLLSACSPPRPPQLEQGTLLPSARAITDFQLTDHNGKPFTHENLKGKWSFAFFGYTHCSDICPTSLSMLAQVIRNLKKDDTLDTPPQVVFVSVDPERDTPELLAEFMPHFDPDFIGATGDPEQLLILTRQLGTFFGKAPDDNADDYRVNHSAAIILFDPEGNFRAVFGAPHDPALIAQDFIAIKNYYEATDGRKKS
ncbi:MAG TPA: SCO family protein [Gammaproteobacteria bacterium]|nr:SCO family protein [Gammaproteobacteria bacterium]